MPGVRPIGVYDPTSPEVRAAAQRRLIRRTHRANAQQVATWAIRATEIARLYPGAPAGDIIAAAQMGLDPHGEDTRLLMERAMAADPPPDAPEPPGKSKGILGRIGDLVGEVDDAALSVVKPVVRTGFTVLEAPLQELQGFVNAAGYANVASRDGNGFFDRAGSLLNFVLDSEGRENFVEVFNDQASHLRRAIGDIAEGDRVELGEGFFAGGKLAERRKAEAERWLIDGNPISTGRAVANKVFEPGTFAYNTLSGLLDATVVLAADPAEIALRSASLAGKSRRTFFDVNDTGVRARAAERIGDVAGLHRRAGLVDVNRKQVILDRATDWLDTEAADLVEQLAGADDFLATYRFLGGHKGKVRATAVADLIDAQTPDEVRAVLMREITEGNLRNKIRAGGATHISRRLPAMSGARVFDMMPRERLDFEDLDDAVEQARRWMNNAKVDEADQSRILNRLIRTESRPQMWETAKEMFRLVERKLMDEHGLPKSKASQLVTSFTNDLERMASYGVTELAEEAAAAGIRINDDMKQLMSPFLFNQLLSRGIPLPDAGDIRTAMSRWAPVLERDLVKRGTAAMEFIQDSIWKRSVLLRGAWTVRVVGEEQVRIAGSGGTSVFNHPLGALAWVLGKRGDVDILGKDFGGVRAAMDRAAIGEADEFSAALARGALGLTDFDRKISRYTQVVDQSDPVYFRALVDEYATLSNDPVARRVARGYPLDGDGVTRGGLEGVQDWFRRSDERRQLAESMPILGTDEGADAYITWLSHHIRNRTGGNDQLRKLIGSRPAAADEGLARELRAVVDATDPASLPGQALADAVKLGREDMGLYDRATQAVFTGLMSIPTNKLSRSPYFRQQYWQRVEEMLPFADADTARQILDQAKAANLGDDVIKRMKAAAAGTGDLDLEQLDVVAKGHALDATRELLYDLNNKSQFFDQMRLVFPFGEAWKEVLTRWASIGRENPQVARRAQQLITGARDAGFFTVDENTGDEMFVYPGSAMLTDALLGVPVEMRGRVAGLNMMGEIMPGFGPVVQIPVAGVLPDSPDLDWINDIVNPFGEPEFTGGIADFFPSWLQKFQTSGWLPVVGPNKGQERLYMSTVGTTMQALAMTGDYDLHGPDAKEEAARLLEDAKRKATGLYLIRGMAQFVSPTAPSPQQMTHDPEGKLVVMQTLAEEFRRMQDEDRDTAVMRFLDTYGQNAFLLTEGKTTGVFGISKEVEDWARRNPDLLEKYPSTYAFFGPVPPDDEAFDYDTYRRQIARGERIPRTPEELLHAAQHRVANAALDAFDDAWPGESPEKSVARGRLQDELVKRFAGYRPFDLSSDLEQNVDEIRAAVHDPKLMDNPTARTVRTYLRLRDRLLEHARSSMGRKDFTSSNDTRPLRDALRLIAVHLQAENPAFGVIYQRLFSHEMRGTEEEAFEEEQSA